MKLMQFFGFNMWHLSLATKLSEFIKCNMVILKKGDFVRAVESGFRPFWKQTLQFFELKQISAELKSTCTSDPLSVPWTTCFSGISYLTLVLPGVVITPLEIFFLSPQNQKEGNLNHLGYLKYILCGHFDENNGRGTPYKGGR